MSMVKRTKQDASADQVTPEGEPITNPEAQLPDAQPVVNEGQAPLEGRDAQDRRDPAHTAILSGSGLPGYDHWSRQGELEAIRPTDRPIPTEPPAASPPQAEGRQDINPLQQAGSDKHYAAPADASQEDVEAARGPDQSEAPPPFRRRDGFPDITSESVQVLMLEDYYPADPSRYGNQIRARKGDLVAFGSDEALALIDAGMAERVDDEKVGFQQDIVQPGDEPLAVGYLPRLNPDTGVIEAPPPEDRRSADPAAAQSATSTPRLEPELPAPGGGPTTIPKDDPNARSDDSQPTGVGPTTLQHAKPGRRA